MPELPRKPPPGLDWTKIGAYLTALSVLVAIVIAFYQVGSSPFNNSGPTAPPTTPVTVPPMIGSRTQSAPATPVPDFVPSAAPPLQAHEKRYKLDFADRTFADLDSGLANTDGGPEYEVNLNLGRFYAGSKYEAWERARVIFVKDSQVSFDGCARGTRIQRQVAHLSGLAQDESICVSTNRGAWAAMKIMDSKPSGINPFGEISFDVRLFTARP